MKRTLCALFLIVFIFSLQSVYAKRIFRVTCTDYDLTMGDATGTITIKLRNANSDSAIYEVEFQTNYFDYWFDSCSPPTGWTVSHLNTNTIRLSNPAGLPKKTNVFFTFVLKGYNNGVLPDYALDTTDYLNSYTVTDPSGFSLKQLSWTDPEWTIHALALSINATPAGASIGTIIDVSLDVENRSTARHNNILPQDFTLSNSIATYDSGPTPSKLNLAAGASGSIVYEYEVQSTGQLYFTAWVQDSSPLATSKVAQSNTVDVANITANCTISAEAIGSGDQVTVTLEVTNGSTISTLYDITPTNFTTLGTATMTYVDGPTPASYSELGPGASAQFVWTYDITGSVGDTYQFSAQATTQGGLLTNVATSTQGVLAAYVISISPDVVCKGASDVTIEFTVSNGSTDNIRRLLVRAPSTNFTYASATGGYNGNWGVSVSGSNEPYYIEFTAADSSQYLPPSTSTTFYITYSSFPTPSADPWCAQFRLSKLYDEYLNEVFSTRPGICLTKYCLELEASPQVDIPADGIETSTITVTVNEVTTPQSGVTVDFSTNGGSLSDLQCTTDANGQCSITLTGPVSELPVDVVVTAEVGMATAQVTVSFIAGSSNTTGENKVIDYREVL